MLFVILQCYRVLVRRMLLPLKYALYFKATRHAKKVAAHIG